jgi:perosamine synthetase
MSNDLIQQSVDIWRDANKCAAFIKGRVALYAILRSFGLGHGDEVIVPGFTCTVVPAAIHYTGATPVFYDIDLKTLQGDPVLAEQAINDRTRAILVQHNFGTPAPLGALPDIAKKRGIFLIEDCAHAMGASSNGQPVGSLGDASFCSLQWSKPTTTGLGGIARIEDENIAAIMHHLKSDMFSEPSRMTSLSMRLLSSLYRSWYRPSWYWTAQGLYRWASVKGLVQGSSSNSELTSSEMPEGYRTLFGKTRRASMTKALNGLPDLLKHRHRIYSTYNTEFRQSHFWTPPVLPDNDIGAALRYPVLVENRSELLELARRSRIELGDWFNAPLHPDGCNSESFGYYSGACPHAEYASARLINLPTHRHVNEQLAKKIVEFVLAHAELPPTDTSCA